MNSKWYQSASRLAFLLLITTSCIGFLMGKLSPELFVPIVMAGAGAYFVAKGHEQNQPVQPTQEVKTPPSV